MGSIRPPAVAGTFYPAEPETLRRTVEGLLAGAGSISLPGRPKALIVPHAGYIYSGPVAASAYAALRRYEDFKRVVLLGPAHTVYLQGLAAPAAQAFATPLGTVPLDAAGLRAALALPAVRLLDEAHRREHSLEVQLPFLQVLLSNFVLVPLVVGEAEPEDTAGVLESLWGGEETLVVVSSDLSHYHDAATARRLDAATARSIEARDWRHLEPEQACGARPIQGLLLAAERQGLRVETLDLRNSGDTAGPPDRVVGYGAFALLPEAARAA